MGLTSPFRRDKMNPSAGMVELADTLDFGDVTSVRVFRMNMKQNQISFHLPKNFFGNHPLKEISAATLTHFKITQQDNDQFDALFAEAAERLMDSVRCEKDAEERRRILETVEPAALVELARKGCEISNQRILCKKLLSCAEQSMPLLLKRYRTCALDHFLEIATTVLATADVQYAQELRQMYPKIRTPYGRACACLVFGVQNMQEELPFLYEEYVNFRKNYPDENFEQHPLLAMYLLCNQL